MSKDKIILNDGTEIALEAGGNLSAIQVTADTRETMLSTWKKFTTENLKVVQIQNGAGLVVGNYENLMLVSECSKVAVDGSVLTVYQLREKTEEERRLDALEEGQEIQDGAIEDLGATTSAMAAQLEGGTQ